RAAFVCSSARFVGAERWTFFTSFSPRFDSSVNRFVARLRDVVVNLSRRVVAVFAESTSCVGRVVTRCGRVVTLFGRLFACSTARSPAPTAAYNAFLAVLILTPPFRRDEIEAGGRRGAG